MKTILKIYLNTKQVQIFSALVLTGILSFGGGLTPIKSAIAIPTNLSETTKEVLKDNISTNRLPDSVADAVLSNLSRKERISTKQLEITDYSQHTWRNGCMELASANEFCTQALVSGWRVVVSNGSQNWIYHTNDTGLSLRLANSDTSTPQASKLPARVKNAVLQAASRRTKKPVSQLTIIQVQQRTWKNGCLEIAVTGFLCSQNLVSGWRVVVGLPEQALVYHTNNSGSVVRLNSLESQISENKNADNNKIKSLPIPSSELPPTLTDGIIFRQISSGGFTGQTTETVLLGDGRLMHYRIGDTNDSSRTVRRISPYKVRQFKQLLEQSGNEFNNLSYPAPQGSADYITYTLTDSEGSIQYNDITQNSLPENLQAIVQAWNKISKTSSVAD